MTLADLASLGTVASAFAVVITLVFLLIQLRHNTVALIRAESTATQTAASVWRMAIVNNRDVARLLTSALAENGDLDEIDELRFGHLLAEIIWFAAHIWHR